MTSKLCLLHIKWRFFPNSFPLKTIWIIAYGFLSCGIMATGVPCWSGNTMPRKSEMTCTSREDLDKHAHSHRLIRVHALCSIGSQWPDVSSDSENTARMHRLVRVFGVHTLLCKIWCAPVQVWSINNYQEFWWDAINRNADKPRHEKTYFSNMRTTKAQISLRWSAPLLFAA